jgi:starch phosphorylase
MTADIHSNIKTDTAVTGRELTPTLAPLRELSWNYWWSWAPDGSEVFRDLDPNLWSQCEQNPRLMLTQISDRRLAEIATDPSLVGRVQRLHQRFAAYMSDSQPWAKLPLPSRITRQNPVAYFCAEFGVHNSLPLYSGGLGILAGDHLKSASDLNLPLIAVGLFYRFGYFRQRMRRDDWQEEEYRENHVDELALRSVDDEQGKPLLIQVVMRGRTVSARVWRAEVGRVQLYLLDTNVPENNEVDRLGYGTLVRRRSRNASGAGDDAGHWRRASLAAIEDRAGRSFISTKVIQAFLTLELAREIIESDGVTFAEAMKRVRERCVFTTHTPVAAGHDEFDSALVEKGFGAWPQTALGLSSEEFVKLGRVDGDTQDSFGLTPLALRMARTTNGVSRKHGEVSRQLWHKMWPQGTVTEVPITSVTNGVHPATWVAPLLRRVYEESVGEDWLERSRDAGAWRYGIEKISDRDLWEAHSLLKQRLVAFVRDISFDARLARGESEEHIEAARTMFDPIF